METRYSVCRVGKEQLHKKQTLTFNRMGSGKLMHFVFRHPEIDSELEHIRKYLCLNTCSISIDNKL